LPPPRLDFSELQAKIVQRSLQHGERDSRRQKSEDTDPYINGVLFGFDPSLPPEQQDGDWKISVKPDSDQLEGLGLAGSAWTKIEQRKMGGGK
jgi:hypothetical protein